MALNSAFDADLLNELLDLSDETGWHDGEVSFEIQHLGETKRKKGEVGGASHFDPELRYGAWLAVSQAMGTDQILGVLE